MTLSQLSQDTGARKARRIRLAAWPLATAWLAAGVAGVCSPDLWGGSSALADGAFPTSQSVLLPSDRPKEIVLAANFGLIFSENDGGSWSYACEDPSATLNASSYLLGPAPANRIYALSSGLGAAVSSDGACTWALGGGALVNQLVNDVFPDPSNADRVFAVAIPAGVANPVTAIFHSEDGGLTYAVSGFATPAGASITGIEVAATEPDRVFATLDGSSDGSQPELARSIDGGKTFELHALGPALGAVRVRLVAIDPTDASVIFLRLFSAPGVTPVSEALAMSRDGGDTWTTPLMLEGGSLVGFVRLPTGTLVALATTPSGAVLVRSKDAGVSFATSPLSFAPKGLAARAGVLFAAADEFPAGETNPVRFSLASSVDEGETWQARLKFSQISGVRACVKAACQSNCAYLSGLTLFPQASCSTSAGSGSGGGAKTGSGGGCSYALGQSRLGWISSVCGAVAVFLGVGATLGRRRRRRRSRLGGGQVHSRD